MSVYQIVFILFDDFDTCLAAVRFCAADTFQLEGVQWKSQRCCKTSAENWQQWETPGNESLCAHCQNANFLFSACLRKLAGCTLFITGGSRGIGKAIALKAARDGANVIIAAKTAVPHPKLPGTIYTAAQEGEQLTG